MGAKHMGRCVVAQQGLPLLGGVGAIPHSGQDAGNLHPRFDLAQALDLGQQLHHASDSVGVQLNGDNDAGSGHDGGGTGGRKGGRAVNDHHVKCLVLLQRLAEIPEGHQVGALPFQKAKVQVAEFVIRRQD